MRNEALTNAMHYELLSDAAIRSPVQVEVLGYWVVLPSHRLRLRDVEPAGRKAASQLRAAFQSYGGFAKTERHAWVVRWPGQGRGKGFSFWMPERRIIRSWAELLGDGFGGWEDLQLFDAHGMLAFSVRHERMVFGRVAARGARSFEESFQPGEAVAPEVVAYLKGASPITHE